LGIFMTLFLVPNPDTQRVDADSQSLSGMLARCLNDRNLMRLNLGIFSLHAILMAIFIAVPGILEEQGLSRDAHWQVYLPMMVVAFVVMVPFIIIAETKNKMREVFLLGIATIVLALLAAACWGQLFTPLLIIITLFFVAFNLMEASLPSLVSKTVYAGGKGTAMGVYSTFQFFGAFCGGAIGGGLFGRWGASAVFAGAAILAGAWLIAAWGMSVPLKSESIVLSWQFGAWDVADIRREVLALPGALDITVLEGERIAYLQVGSDFDLANLPEGLQLGS
jgi:predicted MFS family arabinose efflux permease